MPPEDLSNITTYHIYVKDRCIYHNLKQDDLEETWELLNVRVGLLKTDYSEKDLSFEKAAPTVGVGGPIRIEPSGDDSYQMETVMKFGTPIWRTYNELPRGTYEWALDYKEDNDNKQRSNRGGYQSVAQTFDYLPLPFRKHILDSLTFKDKIRPANWWLNVNEKGDFNFQHTHPKSDLSGIWYLTDNNNSLVFIDPLQHSRSNLYLTFPELDIGEGVYVNAKAGEVLIFPSDIPHYVEPHSLDTTRVSVSFNMHLIN